MSDLLMLIVAMSIKHLSVVLCDICDVWWFLCKKQQPYDFNNNAYTIQHSEKKEMCVKLNIEMERRL